MAGKPVTRQMVKELERRAKERGDSSTVLDVVFDYLAEGQTQADLARDLSQAVGKPISRGTLSTWLNGSTEGKAMLAQAKKACADALVEQSMEILDSADETRESIQLAKERANQRNWMASRMSRADWGDSNAQVNVQVNMPQLHLDALRTRAIEARATPQLPVGDADVEVVQDQ